MLKALIFDVDGTLADTESEHLAAFNAAFDDCGLEVVWSRDDYRKLLQVPGGKERLSHYFAGRTPAFLSGDEPVSALIDRLHASKTERYVASVAAGTLRLRPGIHALLCDARKEGLRLAIATTTSRANVVALLHSAIGPEWNGWFEVIEDASTAARKKPAPDVYQQALVRLGLPVETCLAFEDSNAGLTSALAAGLSVIVTPSPFTQDHDFTGALRILPDLSGITVDQLRILHRGLHAIPSAAQ
jgi:HAD superfamily hydrolase (TIGR01509 family)